MKEIKYRTMLIDDLIPADYNPRLDLQEGDPDYDRLKRSIQEFGFVQNVVYNQQTGHIVGGHQRVKVLRDLGYTELMVAVVDITEDMEKALNIGLNKIEGDWDIPKLKYLLQELQESGLDLDLTGFSGYEMEDLLNWQEEDFGDAYDSEEGNPYSVQITIPKYEITGDKPELIKLVDLEKAEELKEEIRKSKVPEEEKEFLLKAAERYLKFDYKKIAEYYAHSEKELQELMEKLALVIIDYEKAIENGFVEFTQATLEQERAEELYKEDEEEDE